MEIPGGGAEGKEGPLHGRAAGRGPGPVGQSVHRELTTMRAPGFILLLTATALAGKSASTAPAPDVDPNKIINQSYNFLKEREPEMTEAEYALYSKVIPMISAQPEFALKLLEGMIAEEKTSAAFDYVLGNA